MFQLQNTYAELPDRFYSRVRPERFARARLLQFNHELARELGGEPDGLSAEELAEIFSGQRILEGSDPIALVYAAHQFGQWVPRLGDGRAHLLGEVAGQDIQLKGSGRTIYSRDGDGRSALGPVLREYLVSEAMHALGVPTTRALAAVATGESVLRHHGYEPGGIFVRVAASHIRVGTFQYFASRQDLAAVEILLDYSIRRHYPELKHHASLGEQALEFLKTVTARQAELVARWLSYGFIHGVMNTDNFSVAGITIDYGPCAFMDEYQSDKVFSSIDRYGRYRYSRQSAIAQWNILRLAECLIPLIDPEPRRAEAMIQAELGNMALQFAEKRTARFAGKLGLDPADPQAERLIEIFLRYLERESLDFTLAFRHLPDLYHGDDDFYPQTEERNAFVRLWKNLNPALDGLDRVNPLYIPRNHMIQRAIDHAYQGDLSLCSEMLALLQHPFAEEAGCEIFAQAPQPDERVCQTFCGT